MVAPSATVDDILTEEVGPFGRAQQALLLAGGLAHAAGAMAMFTPLFTTPALDPDFAPSAWSCRLPADQDPSCAAIWAHAAAAASGAAPAVGPGFCSLSRDQYVWTDTWQSLTSEMDLVCGQQWKASAGETLFFIGFLTGNGVFGKAADTFGRRNVMLGTALGLCAMCMLTAAATNYWVHTTLRTIMGMIAAGQTLTGYVVVAEYVGPAWRGVAGMIVQAYFILGEFLLAAVALGVGALGWRGVIISAATPSLAVIALIWTAHESPRWLLTVGRDAEATDALRWVARMNRRALRSVPCLSDGSSCPAQPHNTHEESGPDQRRSQEVSLVAPGSGDASAALQHQLSATSDIDLEALVGDLEGEKRKRTVEDGSQLVGEEPERQRLLAAGAGLPAGSEEPCPAVAEQDLLQLLRRPALAKVFVITNYIVLCFSISYYATTLALGTLAGSVGLNFFLAALAELPGYVIMIVFAERVDRKPVVVLGAAMAGAACVGLSLFDGKVVEVLLASLGKFGASTAWALGVTYSGELFPTCCRSSALGVISQAGDVGGILAPVLALASAHLAWARLPFFVIGAMLCVAAGMVNVLPETRGIAQIDTVQDMMRLLHKS